MIVEESKSYPFVLEINCNADGSPIDWEAGEDGDTRHQLIVYHDGSVECDDLEGFIRAAKLSHGNLSTPNMMLALGNLALRAERR